ncbi:hypothetical protein NOK12_20630 [Nocardioides sp. OK12]|uniref:hypothetical protein n=1 Tax=Nocardioides sp. OK12 TaxID=2758661 RepID=UPI0021C35F39|nr:hypothetical protein [Nocardioides sp. OK12]GHJ59545.1 hypothetical protein NOK12_20630 [Nocardioides sp. OK12]
MTFGATDTSYVTPPEDMGAKARQNNADKVFRALERIDGFLYAKDFKRARYEIESLAQLRDRSMGRFRIQLAGVVDAQWARYRTGRGLPSRDRPTSVRAASAGLPTLGK